VITFSDLGFSTMVPVGGFTSDYDAYVGGGAELGSTTQVGFVSTSNMLFQQTTSIGTIGPFMAPGGDNTIVGGPFALTNPYSLTLSQTFSGVSTFQVTGGVAATTPEPATLTLLATGLGGVLLRRRRNRSL
jgi:hypothetical protein